MGENKGIAVYGDANDGRLAPIAAEGLGIGRKLANELGQELYAVLVGSGIAGLAPEAIAGGADRVYLVDDPLLREYQADAYVAVMDKVARQVKPQVIILGQNDVGRDLAPRLAYRLNTSVTLDCVELAIDPVSKRLLQTKPVYGGNALAVYAIDTDPQVVTIRNKAMTPLVPDASRRGEVIKIEAGLEASAIRSRVLEKKKEEVGGIKLEDARVVIAGGRGMGGPEGFQQLGELARLLKGAVGASRPPCDNGWVPDTLQVGLTGKIVAPEVYLAVAISGSSQHLSGCSGAKNIIAINKDPDANIFRQARFGVVGDWKKVLPTFTQKVKELLAS